MTIEESLINRLVELRSQQFKKNTGVSISPRMRDQEIEAYLNHFQDGTIVLSELEELIAEYETFCG